MNGSKLSLQPTEIVALSHRVVSAMQSAAWRQGKVQLALKSPEVEMWAIADPGRLHQVLVSLLHRAVRRTRPGGVVLIGLEGQTKAVIIQVQGSEESLHPDAELPTGGLSLARVEALIQTMGGSFTVVNAPRQGACYAINLPRANR